MSLFAQTMTKAIGDYRLLLRRYLEQADRMGKLQKLRLRDAGTYESDVNLYKVGQDIVIDMENNMSTDGRGYYSYSGIRQFCAYLKEYIANYHLEEDRVVHRAQKASGALLLAIQLTALPSDKLTEEVHQKLIDCNKTVVTLGSREQCELQRETLSAKKVDNSIFYAGILTHFESLMAERFSEAA